MRIACPACAAEYDVPEDRVPAGKIVRCARCGTDWTPVEKAAAVFTPQEAVFAPPPPPPPMPARMALASQEHDFEPAPKRGGLSVAIAWALSLAVLAAAAWGAYARRDDIIHAWPASERAYMALGIPVRP